MPNTYFAIEHYVRVIIALALIAFFYVGVVFLWNRLEQQFVVGTASQTTVAPPAGSAPVFTPDGGVALAPKGKGTARQWAYGVLKHVVGLAAGIGLTLALANFYVYHGFGLQPDIYRKGDPARPWVALTFDDGPNPDYTPRILDVLDTYNVPATFFMLGSQVEKHPELAEDVVRRGHDVGNHTWAHVNVPTTDTQRLYEEMLRTSFAIYDATGVFPQYSRPPRGMYDGRFRRMSNLLGHKVVLWTLSARDWQDNQKASVIVKRIVERIRPGDILLFHDSGGLVGSGGGNRDHTVEALDGVIQGVRAKGLQFVPLSMFLSDVEGETELPDMEEIPTS